MLRNSCSILAASAAFASLAAAAGPVVADPVTALCYRQHRDVVCDVRPGEAKNVSGVSASVGGRPINGVYERFDPGKSTTAWYFLIQQTAHPKDSATAVEQIVKHEGRRNYGVGTFTDKLEQRAAIGASRGEINRVKEIKGLYKSPGDAKTYLFEASNEALEKLTQFPAARKALVLLADGRADFARVPRQGDRDR